MSKKSIFTLVATCSLVLPISISAAEKVYGPGVTDTEIKLGSSGPLSGPASGFSASAKATAAYLRSLNDQGGVNGRKIDFTLLDNAYSPPKAVEQSRRLVEEIGVLAEVGTIGTTPNVATQKYLNTNKVPQLFISAGGRRFNDPKNFPWTIPLYPDFETEGAIAAKFVLTNKPNAKVAILYQNDDFGKDYAKGFRTRMGSSAAQIVAEAPYDLTDPTIDSQILKLKASGADVLVDQSAPKFTAQAIRRSYELGWTPLHIIGSAASNIDTSLKPAGLDKSVGVVTTAFLKKPDDSIWDDDPEVAAYKGFLKRYNPSVDPSEYSALVGYVLGQAIRNVLEMSGDTLTRENLIRQATSLKGRRLPMFLPGIVLNTSPDDYAPYRVLRMARFDGTKWVLIGDPVSAD